MNKESIVLFTKDAFPIDYLPCYGNQYWRGKTPNIDDLAKKGTLFTNFYTAAPSSAMAYLSMFTGKYPYEQDIKRYQILEKYKGITLFDKASSMGFSCHVIWDKSWMPTSYLRSMCYGDNTEIHALDNLHQGVGFHYNHSQTLIPSKIVENTTLTMIENELKKITANDAKVFLWFHLPHVINGRTGYGSDIDLHDIVLGIVRKYFDDSHIFISADHGNMNGHKGKLGYGFDVYESAIHIPLITPRKEEKEIYEGLVSNVDMEKLIFDDVIPKREVIYSDTAYYVQPDRKILIMKDNFRYIYNKADNTEELYDVAWDPDENFNLIADKVLDIDRGVHVFSRELYFYPYWDEIPTVRQSFREYRYSMWRTGSPSEEFCAKYQQIMGRKFPRVAKFVKRIIGYKG